VRTEGAWEAWLTFFLEGVVDVAASATDTTRQIVKLIEDDRQRIHALGRAAATALRVHDMASRFVMLRAPQTAIVLGLSEPTVYSAISRLEELGVLRETTGRQRGRLYVYDSYLSLLREADA
jgi:cell filamentation protein, protein adenylyltransferase